MKQNILISFCLVLLTSLWYGCSRSISDKTRTSSYPVYSIATYDPGLINTSFDHFHWPTGGNLQTPPDAEAKDWGVEHWNAYVDRMKKKAKWERHKKKFYKSGTQFLETFYADLYAPKTDWTAFSAKYASHLDTVLLPLLKSTFEKRHTNKGIAWETFGFNIGDANEIQRLTVKPYKDHWFEVQVVDSDTQTVRVRIDDDRKDVINGLYNPQQKITMSPLIKVKKLFLKNFYNDMSRETDVEKFTKMYKSHCADFILKALLKDTGEYDWSLLSIGKGDMQEITEDDIDYERDGWLWVKPQWYDGPEVRVQLALIKDKLVITGLINPTK